MSTIYPPHLQQFVKQEIASGAFRSEDELVISALTAFREMKLRHEEFRGRVEKSLAQAERGEVELWNMDSILAAAHQRQANRDQ